MKKLFSTHLILMLFTSITFSQEYPIDEGGIMLIGTMNLSSKGGELYENRDEEGLTEFKLSSNFNYFIVKNVFIGGGLDYASVSQGDISVTSLAIGPNFGYAIGQGEKTIYPYFLMGIKYSSQGIGDLSISGIDIPFGGGVIYRLSKSLGIVVEATYHFINLSLEDSDESASGNSLSFSIGFSGFFY